MIQIGTVQSVEFRKNKDGDANTVMLQVELSEPDDIQSVELFTQSGQEIIPENGDEVIIVSLTPSYRIAIAGNDQVIPSMGNGERKIYSTNGGAISAFINFLNTGILELNGNSNFLVKFNELETAFNQLKSDFDTHVHSGVTTGPGTSAIPVSPSTADIGPAKSTDILISG